MKNYPKTIGGKPIYVLTPVQIQQMDLDKTKVKLSVGKWMAVNVHPVGYTRLNSPVQFDTEEECQTACDKYNAYYNFRPKQVKVIISKSMGLTKPTKKDGSEPSGSSANN